MKKAINRDKEHALWESRYMKRRALAEVIINGKKMTSSDFEKQATELDSSFKERVLDKLNSSKD